MRPSAAEDGSRTAVISSPASCWPAMAILSVPSHLICQRQERREQRAASPICPACRGLAAMQTRTELLAHHRPSEPHPQFS